MHATAAPIIAFTCRGKENNLCTGAGNSATPLFAGAALEVVSLNYLEISFQIIFT